MAQVLQLLAWNREGSSKKETCKGMSCPKGSRALASDSGKSKSCWVSHSCNSNGHIGIHIPPLVIHAPRLLLAEVPGYTCSFPTATCASSCLHRHKHMSGPGEAKVHIPQLCSWRDLTKNLQPLRRDLNSCLQWSEPSLFGYSFPEGPGVNGL